MRLPGVVQPLLIIAVIAAALGAPQSASSAAVTSPADAALVSLCRVWNAVRFFHPALQSEADQRWEDAGVAAIAAVEHDPSSLKQSTATMLATLHDPLTYVPSLDKPGATALPSAELHDGIRIVQLNGYAGDERAYQQALQRALTPENGDRAMVVDLRIAGTASIEQIVALHELWERVSFAAPLIGAPIQKSLTAQRYYFGFAPEKGATSGSYREGRETTAEPGLIVPASGAHAIPVAFVVDRTAVVPSEAVALVSAGAEFFSTDDTPGILDGLGRYIDGGGDLQVTLRIGAPLDPPLPQHGDLDVALAWARAPRPHVATHAAAADKPVAERYADTALPDEAHRIFATFRMWGTIAYAEPYRDLMHDDWDAALATGIRDVRSAQTSLDYDLALMKQYAHVHDSHGFMTVPAVRDAYAATPAFLARDVEKHLTIVRVDPLAAKRDGFRVGDVIESVDGERVEARARRLLHYLDSSTDQAATEALDSGVGMPSILAGPSSSLARLMLRRNGRTISVTTMRLPATSALFTRTRPAIDILPGNIGYVDLQRLENPQIDGMLARLQHTRAIVFDLRGYPRGTIWPLAPHLATRPVRTALFRTPFLREPLSQFGDLAGAVSVNGTRDFYQATAPAAPHLAQPIVVLIDARASSQSEHTALYLKAVANARFIGQPTDGVDGDVTRMVLPGGVVASFSGQAVLHPNGAQLQRIGIIPDIRVNPTIRSIRHGDDEILTAGLREALHLAHSDAQTTRRALNGERNLEIADASVDQRVPTQFSDDAQPLPQQFAPYNPGYDGGADSGVRHSDGKAIVLRSTSEATSSGFGSLTEALPVDAYRGKRIKVSGYLRSASASHAAFWLRVDGPDGQMDGFDNMSNRALVGNADWTPFVIVLDVPEDAKQIVGGLLLIGTGTVWADDLHIQVVSKTVQTTAL